MFQAVGLGLTLNELRSYGERKLFGLEVQKNCFTDGTTIGNLADRTAQK